MTIDVGVPVDGQPASRGGFGTTAPAIEAGEVVLDLSRANVHLVRLTEDLQRIVFSGSISLGRSVTCTVRITQGDPVRQAPALDALVWLKGRPELPTTPGGTIWVSMITVDGGATWEAFG